MKVRYPRVGTGDIGAEITIRRYFHDCPAWVTGWGGSPPEKRGRHYPGHPGEVNVHPLAEAEGPLGKFIARLTDDEMDEAENAMLEKWRTA